MNQTFFTKLLAVLALCASLSSLHAQSESGSAALQGTVTDPSGAVIPGATVSLRNSHTGYERKVVTGATGGFSARVLPVGRYDVEVRAEGFRAARVEGVVVTVGMSESVNVQLSIAQEGMEIVVIETISALDTEEAGAATLIDERAVYDLPVRGRNFTEFAQLTPGIVQEADRSGLIVAGQRSINSNVALDGADFNDPIQGNQRGGNESVFFFPQSAVREFQVVRSGAGAEIGRTNAGFVNVVTKSGSNDLHGDLFYFNRNRRLTSPNAFDRSLDNRQNQFGGSLGGALLRDRLFVFAAAEQNFLRVPFVVEFAPQAAGVVVPAELRALEGEKRGTNNPTAGFSRLDWNVNQNHSVNVHYTFTRMRGENFDFDSPRSTSAESTNYARSGDSQGVKTSLVSVLSPKVLNEVRGQIATDDRAESPNDLRPQIRISGFGRIGGNNGRPRRFESTRYQVSDNLSGQHGRHQWKTGFDLNVNTVFQQRESNISGRYDYRNLAEYNQGRINRYRQTMPARGGDLPFFDDVMRELAFHVQDRVMLHRRLTLTAGLRWEGQFNPQPIEPNPAIPETTSIPNDLNQWQPRLGLAWALDSRDRTVLRLSSGIFTARTPANLFQRVFTNNGLATFEVDSRFNPGILTTIDFPNALTALPQNVAVAAPRVFGFDPSFRNPRSFQAAATLEHRFSRDLSASVGYIRNSTWSLQRRLNRNLFPPTIDEFGMPVFPRERPNPNIGWLSVNESTAHSNYDGMLLTLTKRMSRKFQLQGNYTLARNNDDDSNERNFSQEPALNPFDLSMDRGPSKQDVRHSFNTNAIVDLPGGVAFSTIVMARSGFPYTPVIGFDTQGDGNDDNDRAIIDGRVVGRNSFRQPSFFNLDFRLMKSFRMGESAQFDVIGELFNATRARNRNFGNDAISEFGLPSNPVPTAGEPLFAPSTARFGGPRQLQLGVRLTF